MVFSIEVTFPNRFRSYFCTYVYLRHGTQFGKLCIFSRFLLAFLCLVLRLRTSYAMSANGWPMDPLTLNEKSIESTNLRLFNTVSKVLQSVFYLRLY